MTANLLLLSDFNVSAISRYILKEKLDGELSVSEIPYGQVFGALNESYGNSNSDFSFVWCRPEAISAHFNAALKGHKIDQKACIDEIRNFYEVVRDFSKSFKSCFVASMTLSEDIIDYGLLDWKPGIGLKHLINLLNIELAEIFSNTHNVFMLDASRWIRDSRSESIPKMWYAAKAPFHNNVYECAAKNLISSINAINGSGKKILFLDLDNTLWGDVVGENGWKGIRLGGHDHIGEAFVDFQNKLKALTLRGIQLAIVSKNEESVALAAIDNHPDMVLQRSDFVSWRINWSDKAQNISEILSEVNLGDYSAVFIDDNPVERDRVRSALPNVVVPEWPEDPCKYVRFLVNLGVFNFPSLSKEDRDRTQSYAANRERISLKENSMENWLEQLGTVIIVSDLNETNVNRAAQLFNKTNQLNLSTRRMTGEELLKWSQSTDRKSVVCSVSDKFGDLGLTGIFSIEFRDSEAFLVDFVLSCRVMGREVEEAMLFLVCEQAAQKCVKFLRVCYKKTDRNLPTLKMLKNSSLVKSGPHDFVWDCSSNYAQPLSVAIEHK
ncbi:HAD-IIIC family phosphatase [Amylibacter sp.]|nr:HAD-IIIC family phosphatase [Amylibacter sp.]